MPGYGPRSASPKFPYNNSWIRYVGESERQRLKPKYKPQIDCHNGAIIRQYYIENRETLYERFFGG